MITTQKKPSTFAQNAINLTILLTASSTAFGEENSNNTQKNEVTNDFQTVLVQGYKDKNSAEVNYFPATTAAVSAEQLDSDINVMNAEDAVKYLPSINVRKRYIGDTNAPIATRTTGINASARSLIYSDGILLSTLIANNNGNGSPQWFLVSPDEIERIDIIYGPYSAAYAGNSYGSVVDITTHMPTKLEGNFSIRGASQHFNEYATNDTYNASEYNVNIGDKWGNFSWLISAEHLNSDSQPITYAVVTQSTNTKITGLPIINGNYADFNKLGSAIQVIGAGNLNNTLQDSAKVKLAYDITPSITASYSFAQWRNDANAKAESYLKDSTGADYFGASSGNVNISGYSYSANTIAGQFARNQLNEERRAQSLSLKSHDNSEFNWEIVATDFDYAKDTTRSSTVLYSIADTGGSGRINDTGGTGWSTLDAKGILKTTESQLVSFGVHLDRYELVSPTYNTSNWLSGDKESLYSNALGKTQTQALWLQDIIQVEVDIKATLGIRYEDWKAYDGYNYAITSAGQSFGVNQPEIDKSGVSPKASLSWQADDVWTLTGSLGKALRFPTVGELYQNIQTGSTYTAPNPNLNPEHVISEEVAFERHSRDSRLRISLFDEDVRDAIISQTSIITSTITTPFAFAQNIDRTHQRGIEIVVDQTNLFMDGYDVNASVTYAQGIIAENSSYVPSISGATSIGKNTPYIPKWRFTLLNTLHATPNLALTLAGRYSSRQYSTVDNTDVYTATYQGFQQYAVIDVRATYIFDKNWTAAIGVDNLNNNRYFLYHPFPQRTAFGELKYKF